MKRLRLVLLVGIIAALAAYAGFYFATKSKPTPSSGLTPELAWLKSEFQLSDAQLTEICQLHNDYVGCCAQRCQMICFKTEELERLLAATNRMTPDIEKALNDSAQLRANCQKAMLEHFYQISKTMPPEQGKRYLAWVMQRTVLAEGQNSK